MSSAKILLGTFCGLVLALSGCSRQQSDWQKTRETNTTDAYEQYLKEYPSGEFTAQAQARVKELYEERDWQKARDADTPEAYQAFLKQYPEGKWTEEARIRVENFTLAQAPSASGASTSPSSPDAVIAAASAGSGPSPAAVGAAPRPVAALPALPAAPLPAATLPKPATSAALKSSSAAYAIQLGAFKSGAQAAHERWAHLQKKYPAVLGGLAPKVVHGKTASGSLYRLQATGLTEQHARAICGSLAARSQACIVVPPA